MTVLWVVLGAAVGAPLRYLTDRFVQARHDSVFPWGTWTVNVVGSFLMGLLAAGWSVGGVSEGVVTGLGTGFCGALTTYSTFGYETVRLAQEGLRGFAVANIVSSVVTGLGAATAGAALALAIWT